MTKSEYTKYLKSPHWIKIRDRALSRHRNKCRCCGDNVNLEGHHKTYIRLGKEKVTDIQILCGENNRGCHYMWHERQKSRLNIRPSYIIHRMSCWFLKEYVIKWRRD